MSCLICGSLAFDNIMRFEGRFADAILPNQLHQLNVSFYVPNLKREFGGCAGNIAYSLRLLGGTPVPMATLGLDGVDYRIRLEEQGISTQFIRVIPDTVTAMAMIMTDNDNNQITAFHPGAMASAHQNKIQMQSSDIKLAIISPDGRQAMVEHSQQLAAAGIPFVFDPGQAIPMFDGADLRQFIELATWVTVNDYEAKMLSDRTGWSERDIAAKVKGYAITLGERGAKIWEGQSSTLVQANQPENVMDPTGCGDAWRGGLLFGLEQGWSLNRCALLGNQLAALKIATQGGQNYHLTADFSGLR